MPVSGRHIIEPGKINDYFLSETHPAGRAKAVFFKSFGFDGDDLVRFAKALEAHTRTRPVAKVVESPFGTKRELRCTIATPGGRNPCIVAIWLQTSASDDHRLITAYPAAAP